MWALRTTNSKKSNCSMDAPMNSPSASGPASGSGSPDRRSMTTGARDRRDRTFGPRPAVDHVGIGVLEPPYAGVVDGLGHQFVVDHPANATPRRSGAAGLGVGRRTPLGCRRTRDDRRDDVTPGGYPPRPRRPRKPPPPRPPPPAATAEAPSAPSWPWRWWAGVDRGRPAPPRPRGHPGLHLGQDIAHGAQRDRGRLGGGAVHHGHQVHRTDGPDREGGTVVTSTDFWHDDLHVGVGPRQPAQPGRLQRRWSPGRSWWSTRWWPALRSRSLVPRTTSWWRPG